MILTQVMELAVILIVNQSFPNGLVQAEQTLLLIFAYQSTAMDSSLETNNVMIITQTMPMDAQILVL